MPTKIPINFLRDFLNCIDKTPRPNGFTRDYTSNLGNVIRLKCIDKKSPSNTVCIEIDINPDMD